MKFGKRTLQFSFVGSILVLLVIFVHYWISTQPIWIQTGPIDDDALNDVPAKNREIVRFVEAHGRRIAPVYNDVVCTEFVIRVIDLFDTLTPAEKNKVRIITQDDLGKLIDQESPVIKGVQTALVQSQKGIEISALQDIRPGDFVQFWNNYNNNRYGHCGIVLDVTPNRSLTVYSSHPLTRGFGMQTFLWPDKVYVARLK